MFRAGKITLGGNRSIGNILIWLSLPCVIINGFRVERSAQNVHALLLSALLAALALAISVVLSKIVFHQNPVSTFASTFPNPGFFGVFLFSAEKKKITLKDVLTAPLMAAILIGLFLFFTKIPLPDIISSSVGFIAGLNTPLAMFTIGVYAAQTGMRAMLRRKELYRIAMIRQLIVPIPEYLEPQARILMEMAMLAQIKIVTARIHNYREFSCALYPVMKYGSRFYLEMVEKLNWKTRMEWRNVFNNSPVPVEEWEFSDIPCEENGSFVFADPEEYAKTVCAHRRRWQSD